MVECIRDKFIYYEDQYNNGEYVIKLLSLFSGIGAFESALKNLNMDHEVVNFSEIYQPAIDSYCKLYNTTEDQNLGDITKVNPSLIDDFDLMSYGFPCTSFSIAGKRLGMDDPKTGNLFYESMKIVKEKKPKYLIAENVKGLKNHDDGNTFKIILDTLKKLGYQNYHKVLNSSFFGIPQNRERVFIISVRNDIKDEFHFPVMTETSKKVKDIIDFTIKDRIINKDLIPHLDKNYYIKYNTNKVFDGCQIGVFKDGWTTHRLHTIYGISPTLTKSDPGPYFLEISGALVGKERMRLQGFTDEDYDKIKGVVSENQLHQLTGNSITVNVLEGIFRNLFDKEYVNSRIDLISNWE